MRKSETKYVVYMGFMDLEKAYDRVNREALCQVLSAKEALWQVLRMYNVGSKLLTGIQFERFHNAGAILDPVSRQIFVIFLCA